jgi:hypothetical protein
MILAKLISVSNYGSNREKAIKLIMDANEKESFIRNASIKVLNEDSDFKDYLVNGWRKAEPYDEEEQKLFEGKEIYSIMFYSKHMAYVVLYFALLISVS